MRVNLLGNFAAQIGGVSIAPSASKPSQILAILALNSDRTVTKSTLFEEIWNGRPPVSAATTLQTYIHQLRRLIDRAITDRTNTSRDVLSTERGGYCLRLEENTDVREFHALSRRGMRAHEDGEFRYASELLGAALDLWRADFLADLPLGPVLAMSAIPLEDLRTAVLNRRVEADLRLGRHNDMTGELRALAQADPINETFAANLMACLYNAGQVAQALAEYQRIRQVLIDELGVEPTRRLCGLQQVILNGGNIFGEVAMIG